jgi:hypothetical protein
MRLWIRRLMILLGALGLPASFAAAASLSSHPHPSSTATTLPCVDVTVHVTEPPPWIYVCPLAAQSD